MLTIRDRNVALALKPGGDVASLPDPKPQQFISGECEDKAQFLLGSGLRGRPGPTGPAGSASITCVAGETISALRLVYESGGRVYLLDPATERVQAIVGLTTSAAAEGGDITILRMGPLNDNGWSWVEGLLFAGPAGTITQTPPVSGWEVVVGFSPSPTRIYFELGEPVLLA